VLSLGCNKIIRRLRIEIRTGKVAVLIESNYGEIIQADNNILIVQRPYLFGTFINTMNYDVGTDKPVISKNFYSQTYKKTELGCQVAERINFYFETLIDNIYYEVVGVYFYPPCFASKISESDLLIDAILPGSKIEIDINNFNGM